MVTLYNLTGQYRALTDLVERIDEETGEVVEDAEIRAVLDGLDAAVDVKLDACARVVRELEAEAEVASAEACRLKRRADRLEENADRLKHAMRDSMLAVGKRKVTTALFTLSLRTPPPHVVVTDFEALPASLLRVVPERREPDKGAIRATIEAGKDVPGAELEDGEPSLIIR